MFASSPSKGSGVEFRAFMQEKQALLGEIQRLRALTVRSNEEIAKEVDNRIKLTVRLCMSWMKNFVQRACGVAFRKWIQVTVVMTSSKEEQNKSGNSVFARGMFRMFSSKKSPAPATSKVGPTRRRSSSKPESRRGSFSDRHSDDVLMDVFESASKSAQGSQSLIGDDDLSVEDLSSTLDDLLDGASADERKMVALVKKKMGLIAPPVSGPVSSSSSQSSSSLYRGQKTPPRGRSKTPRRFRPHHYEGETSSHQMHMKLRGRDIYEIRRPHSADATLNRGRFHVSDTDHVPGSGFRSASRERSSHMSPTVTNHIRQLHQRNSRVYFENTRKIKAPFAFSAGHTGRHSPHRVVRQSEISPNSSLLAPTVAYFSSMRRDYKPNLWGGDSTHSRRKDVQGMLIRGELDARVSPSPLRSFVTHGDGFHFSN